MTYQPDYTIPDALMEEIIANGLDVIPEICHGVELITGDVPTGWQWMLILQKESC